MIKERLLFPLAVSHRWFPWHPQVLVPYPRSRVSHPGFWGPTEPDPSEQSSRSSAILDMVLQAHSSRAWFLHLANTECLLPARHCSRIPCPHEAYIHVERDTQETKMYSMKVIRSAVGRILDEEEDRDSQEVGRKTEHCQYTVLLRRRP